MKISINYTKYIPYKAGVIVDTYKIAEYIDEVTWNYLEVDELMDYLSTNIEDILKELGYLNDVDFLSAKDVESFKHNIFPLIETDLKRIKNNRDSTIDWI